MSHESETFAQRLRRLMAEKGLSQTDLAAKTEIDRSELNRIINGKRPPKPREAAWLIERLGTSFDDFMEGLEVKNDPAFADEVALHQRIARNYSEMERERDEAKVARNVLDATLRAQEAAWRDERKQLQENLRDVRKDCADRVKQRDDELAKRENELLLQLSEARDRLAELERQRRDAAQLADDRLRQIAVLTKQIDAERSKVTSAGLFGGLVGALLGAGGVAAATANADDDEDDD